MGMKLPQNEQRLLAILVLRQMRTLTIDVPAVWASVSLSLTRATVLAHSLDGTTMWLLLQIYIWLLH